MWQTQWYAPAFASFGVLEYPLMPKLHGDCYGLSDYDWVCHIPLGIGRYLAVLNNDCITLVGSMGCNQLFWPKRHGFIASKIQKDGQQHKRSQKQETQSQLKRLTSKHQELHCGSTHSAEWIHWHHQNWSTHLAMEEVPESWCGVHLDQRKQMDIKSYLVLKGVGPLRRFMPCLGMD